jgi:hypothetical protein
MFSGVAITQMDRISRSQVRVVASITLMLRKPLYVPANTNGTVSYRQAQDALPAARDQEMRYDLFASGPRPEPPVLPPLFQHSHAEGETIVVRVPFVARRFGWSWRLEKPHMELSSVNRTLVGETLDRFQDGSYLIYGDAATLAEIRQRVKQANDYIRGVAKAVQRQAEVMAVAEKPAPAEATEASTDAEGTEEAAEGTPAEAAKPATAPASLAGHPAKPAPR